MSVKIFIPAQLAKKETVQTIPFFKVPKADRDEIAKQLRELCEDNPDKINSTLIESAIRMAAHRNSALTGASVFKKLQYGEGVYIFLLEEDFPAQTSISQLQKMLAN